MGIVRAEEAVDFFERGIEQISTLDISQEEKSKLQIYYMFAVDAIKKVNKIN